VGLDVNPLVAPETVPRIRTRARVLDRNIETGCMEHSGFVLVAAVVSDAATASLHEPLFST
jgi:hypothetical protein